LGEKWALGKVLEVDRAEVGAAAADEEALREGV
jgi:hypothetical protein